MTLRSRRDPRTGVPVDDILDTARESPPASLAGIWKCPNCRAQIQVIVAPKAVPVQPFTCTCGAPMLAGEEH